MYNYNKNIICILFIQTTCLKEDSEFKILIKVYYLVKLTQQIEKYWKILRKKN